MLSTSCSGNGRVAGARDWNNPWLIQGLCTAMAGQYSTFQNTMEMEYTVVMTGFFEHRLARDVSFFCKNDILFQEKFGQHSGKAAFKGKQSRQ
jgi:hypothetical protein